VALGCRISRVAPDLGFGYILSPREYCQLITKVERMSAKSLIQVVATAAVLAACSPVPPVYFGPPSQSIFSLPGESLQSRAEAGINSDAFAKRPPLPGQRGYLETIRFIDDGVRYIDPFAEFFISANGQMCFRGIVNRQLPYFENYQNYWCMDPTFVNNVEELENNTTTVNSVRLWCILEAPQCARRTGFWNFLDESSWIGNSISAETRPSREQRAAIEHLIYLMGGNVRTSQASAR
jgi:hypothetical protein